MSCYTSIVCKNISVPNNAIMSNMRICHQKIIGSYGCYAFILDSASMNSNALSEDISISYFKFSLFAFKFFIRGILSNSRKLIKNIVLTNYCRAP